MSDNKTGKLDISWRVTDTSTIVVVIGNAPMYRINLKALDPEPRLNRAIRDAIVNSLDHALSEKFGLIGAQGEQ
jgi:hypothetical protein